MYTFKVPMNEDVRIALEDCFIDDDNMDARKFVFQCLKQACQDAKRSLRNKITPTNQRQEDGQLKQVEASLKGVDLSKYVLDSNPEWLPEGLDKEENKPLELKLGDNTMNYLKSFGQIILIRHEKFNEAEEKYLETQREKMKENAVPANQITNWEKQQETLRKKRLSDVPNCLEEAWFTSIWPIIQQKIDQSDSVIFDKEFQELNEEKPSK